MLNFFKKKPDRTIELLEKILVELRKTSDSTHKLSKCIVTKNSSALRTHGNAYD